MEEDTYRYLTGFEESGSGVLLAVFARADGTNQCWLRREEVRELLDDDNSRWKILRNNDVIPDHALLRALAEMRNG